MAKRRKSSAEFKARVALVGDKTMAERAKKHHVHPDMIGARKRQTKDQMPEIFAQGPSPATADKDAEIERLHEKIGQLSVEVDSLAKAFRR